jgi:prepilin-type N-terminal cleavage/methylation domain-containing protein
MGDKTMKTGKRGFTLIELIVVIAILAILALLIVPRVTGYVNQANDVVAKANAKTCYNEYLAWKAAKDSGLNHDTGYYPSDFKEYTLGMSPGKYCIANVELNYLANTRYVATIIGPVSNKRYYVVDPLTGNMTGYDVTW